MKVTNRRIMLAACLMTATSFSSVNAMEDDARLPERQLPASADSDTPAALAEAPSAARIAAPSGGDLYALRVAAPAPSDSDDETAALVATPLADPTCGEVLRREPLREAAPAPTYSLFLDPEAVLHYGLTFDIQDILAHAGTDPLAAKLVDAVREMGDLRAGAASDPLAGLNCRIKIGGAIPKTVKQFYEMDILDNYGSDIKEQLAKIIWPSKHSLFKNPDTEQSTTVAELLANLGTDSVAKKIANELNSALKRALTIETADAGAGYGDGDDDAYPRRFAPPPPMMRRGGDEVNTEYLSRFESLSFSVNVPEIFYASISEREPDLSYLYEAAQEAAAASIPEKARKAVALAQTAGVFGDLEISEYPTEKALAKTLLSRVHGLIAEKAARQDAEISALRASSSLLQDAHTALEGELSTATAAHDATKALLATKADEAFQSKCQLTKALGDIDFQKRTNTSLTGERDAAKASLAAKTSELAAKTSTLGSLTTELDALKGVNVALSAKFEAATARLSAVNAARDAYFAATNAARDAFIDATTGE